MLSQFQVFRAHFLWIGVRIISFIYLFTFHMFSSSNFIWIAIYDFLSNRRRLFNSRPRYHLRQVQSSLRPLDNQVHGAETRHVTLPVICFDEAFLFVGLWFNSNIFQGGANTASSILPYPRTWGYNRNGPAIPIPPLSIRKVSSSFFSLIIIMCFILLLPLVNMPTANSPSHSTFFFKKKIK